jgi:F-type H+-transporting ATPase subunit a
MTSPLQTAIWFHIGPVPISRTVATTWIIMAVLTIASALLTRRLRIRPSRVQAMLEMVIAAFESQIRDTMRAAPARYMPMIATLFLYILAANWSSIVPGVEPPTAHIETDAALGIIVFAAVIAYGIRARGLLGYLKSFAEPTIFMAPLNFAEAFTRIFSMIVRLFGNIMSGVFVIGVVLSLAGLIVPIPLMALDILTGAIQAYIFTVLAMVFIGSAVSEPHLDEKEPSS